MLTLTPLSDRALEIVAEGRLEREDVPRAMDQLLGMIDRAGKVDLLVDVHGVPSFGLDVIAEEMKYIPDLFRLVRGMDRVAVVADSALIRALTQIESALIPGISYEVYERDGAAYARAWILRETDQPRPA